MIVGGLSCDYCFLTEQNMSCSKFEASCETSRAERVNSSSLEEVMQMAHYEYCGQSMPVWMHGEEKTVPLYQSIRTGVVCILKIIKENEYDFIEQIGFAHPTALLFTCSGPNDKVQYGVLMPYLDGDLFAFIKDKPDLPVYTRLVLIKTVIGKVKFLHERNFVHRDIKPENIVYGVKSDGDLLIYLIDFEYAVNVGQPSPSGNQDRYCGTKSYVAPEIVSMSEKPDYKLADAWSLGATLFVILFGALPISKGNVVTTSPQYHDLKNGTYSDLMRPLLQDILVKHDLEGTSLYDAAMNAFTEVICKLMTVNPEHRMSVADAFTKINSILQIPKEAPSEEIPKEAPSEEIPKEAPSQESKKRPRED
jgi:serine/threonine protein kinase